MIIFSLFKRKPKTAVEEFIPKRPLTWWIDDLSHEICGLVDHPTRGLDKLSWPDYEKVYLAVDKTAYDELLEELKEEKLSAAITLEHIAKVTTQPELKAYANNAALLYRHGTEEALKHPDWMDEGKPNKQVDFKDIQKAVYMILGLTYNGNVEEAWAREVQKKYNLSWDEQFRREYDQQFPDTKPGGSYRRPKDQIEGEPQV